MKKKKWTHLYDQFGQGPHDPLYLPEDITGLADDPYRSLAWIVRLEKGYKNTSIPFADFEWANYFREKKLLHCKFERDFRGVTAKAVKLALSSEAKKLPGFVGKA
jgi:hypothetical protein